MDKQTILETFKQWSNEKYCLKAVENDGDALRYVKEQSEAVCLRAVENDGDALRYVKEQSEAVCLKAVETNAYALQYVKKLEILKKLIIKLKIN